MDTMTQLALFAPMIALVVLLALRWFRASAVDRHSVHAQDASLSDVAFSAVGQLGDQGAKTGVDGRTELRPPFGQRILIPLFAVGLLMGYDPRQALSDMGLTVHDHQTYVMVIVGAAFVYTVIELNFRQRIVYDRALISAWGVTLRRQDRDLSQLLDIRLHESRPVLALSFADAPDLFVPKHLSGRSSFIADMEAIIKQNAPPLVLTETDRVMPQSTHRQAPFVLGAAARV